MAPRNALWSNIVLGLALVAANAPALAADSDLEAAKRAVRMKQFDKALDLYQQIAATGDAEAQYQLAMLYLLGRGTAKDPERGQRLLEQAASANHAAAQYALAQELLSRDPAKAQALLESSAAQGYRAATQYLARSGQAPRTSDHLPLLDQWLGAARAGDVAQLEALRAKGVEVNSRNSAGRTALFFAVQANRSQAVDYLLSAGAEVDGRDKLGLTPLQTAVERGHVEMIKRLLKAGAKADQTLQNGDNLLHYAIRMEQQDALAPLLAARVPVNHRNNAGWTPLDLAEHRGAERAVAALSARGAAHGENWRQGRAEQNVEAFAEQIIKESEIPPVAAAVINSRPDLVKAIVAKNPRELRARLPDGTNLLALAVRHENPKMLRTLLRLGATPDSPGFQGATALQVAARAGREAMVSELLRARADPLAADDNGRTPLYGAIEGQQAAIAELLLKQVERRSDFDSGPYLLAATEHRLPSLIDRLLPMASGKGAVDGQGRNALWFAANAQNSSLIGKLLNAEVAADARDHLGRTPFMIAVERGCFECARQLLPFSDINQQTDSGTTALMAAAHNGDAELVAWLIQSGADVEVRNQRGSTALMEAVTTGSIPVVEHLLAANASVTRKNKLGFSALDLAKQSTPEMLALVRSKAVLGVF